MGKDRIKFVYAGALIALVIELLFIINGYFENTLYIFRGIEASVLEPVIDKSQPDFAGMISLLWSSIIGTVSLGILFVYRLIKGASALFELLSTALWGIQLYFLFEASKPYLDINMAGYNIFSFIWAYILAFLGIIAMLVVVICDFLTHKKNKN